jgi:response regulator RpfG family c-di-GMP phosphodiesterase
MIDKPKIFILEDELITAESIRASLTRNGYTVTGIASSGETALKELEKNPSHLVLVDIRLKGDMDGIETARHITERFGIPVIYLSAFADKEILEKVKLTESYGYLIKPFNDKELSSNIEIAIYKHKSERLVRESEEKYRELYDKQKKTLRGIIEAMAIVVETRDPYTAGHQRRVSELAGAIAREMKSPDDILEGTIIAAGIHDIGKLGVPSELLSKPARLNEIEFQLIKTHSKTGYDILKNIDFPWPVAEIVYQHHEKINGTGYPRGLTGKDILIESRIITVADITEAIASHRPYRPKLGIDIALKELSACRGVLYDAEVVDTCIRLFNQKDFAFSAVKYGTAFGGATDMTEPGSSL